MNRHICIITIPLLLGGMFLAGCGQHRSTTAAFGSSVKTAMAQQTINHEPAGTDPVMGLDGKWAAQSMDNYQTAPEPAREVKSNNLGSLFDIGGKQ